MEAPNLPRVSRMKFGEDAGNSHILLGYIFRGMSWVVHLVFENVTDTQNRIHYIFP